MFGVLVVVFCPDGVAALDFSLGERQIPLIVSLRVVKALLFGGRHSMTTALSGQQTALPVWADAYSCLSFGHSACGLPLERASAALDRNQRRDGTAGHLSGKDRAARRPTRRSPAADAPTRRRRPGGCQCERKRAITEGVRPRRVVNAAKTEARGALFLVGFSDDRRLVVLILFVFFVLAIIIIIVWVSRRHRVAHDRGEAPVDQPEVLGDVRSHVGLLVGCRDTHGRMLGLAMARSSINVQGAATRLPLGASRWP